MGNLPNSPRDRRHSLTASQPHKTKSVRSGDDKPWPLEDCKLRFLSHIPDPLPRLEGWLVAEILLGVQPPVWMCIFLLYLAAGVTHSMWKTAVFRIALQAGVNDGTDLTFTLGRWQCSVAVEPREHAIVDGQRQVVQGSLFLIAGRMALVPAALYLAYQSFITYAISTGWMRNTYMDNVIPKKFAAQFPDTDGQHGTRPADSDVVVFLIGTRSNHPLGILAPGFKDMGTFFPNMVKDLEANAEEFGFLGMTSWLNTDNRTSKSELMQVGYFRTTEDLHKFAHSEYHMKGWTWWNRHVKQYPHISIWHETYHVPKGHWESIYINSHAGGITSTTHRYLDKVTGREMWASPIVDASRGLLKTSAGRMSRSQGDEHDKLGTDPYQ
nr:monooxygenase [Quercus suber]